MSTKLIKTIQAAIGQHPLLGSVVYWSFSDVDVPAEEVQKAFQRAGLEFKVGTISDRRALTKALSVLKGAAKNKIVEKIIENADQAVYAVLGKEVDRENLELDVENLNAVIYDKSTHEISFKRNGDEVSTEVDELFNSLQGTYNAEDMRRLTKRYLMSIGACTLRERGGVYFVPVTKLEELNKYAHMVETNFKDSYVTTLGIVDTSKTKTSVARDFNREMNDTILAAEKELESILDVSEIKASTLAVRLRRFRGFEDKIKMYAELLETDATKLNKKIKQLQKRVNDLFTSEDDEV